MVDMVIHVKKNCFGQLTPPHSTQRGVVSVWDFQRPYLMNAEVSNIKLCQCKEDVMLSSANAHGPGAPVRAANFQPLLEHPITAGPPRDPISSPMLLEYFTGFGQIVEVGEDLGPSSSLGWKDQTPSPSHLMTSPEVKLLQPCRPHFSLIPALFLIGVPGAGQRQHTYCHFDEGLGD
eukprot:1143194-Pelagomonas_calceolata.AAC.2